MKDNNKMDLNFDFSRWDALLPKSSIDKYDLLDAVEISSAKGQQFSVNIQDGEIDNFSLSQINAVGLKADCGQIGYAYSEKTDQEAGELMKKAIDNAACAESEDAGFMRFYEGSKDSVEPAPPIDERLLKMTAGEKIKIARKLERMALASDPAIVRLQNCCVSTGISAAKQKNSLGLSIEQSQGYAMAYCMPIAEKDGEVKNGFAYDIARCVEELDIAKIVKEAKEDTLSQFGARPVSSGRYNMILKSDAMISLLEAFMSLFSADAAQKGFSILAGREGENIASAIVDIIDDPRHPKLLMQTAYDAEGVASEKTSIVKSGRFETFMHNRKTALKAGTKTTANASGTLSSAVGVGPTGFYLVPSEKSRKSLIKQLKDGLYIVDFSGLHSGVNPVAGSFSLLARGFLVENGELVRPVEQIAVASQFIDLLKQTVEIASDLKFGLSQVASPSVLVEGIQVAGQ